MALRSVNPIRAQVQVMSEFRGEAKVVRNESDENGKFELEFRLADIQQRIDGEDWKYGLLVANADEYGPAGIRLSKLHEIRDTAYSELVSATSEGLLFDLGLVVAQASQLAFEE
ncbi:hypothetical protein ACFL2H_11735 [Planctomycetota bacterium]